MRFQCQQCRTILELDDAQPGELVQCDKCGTAVTVPEPLTPRAAIGGEFIINRVIGNGGMGTVFLAHQISLDRDVAVKVISPDGAQSGQDIEAFINEARSAAAINHPNIVQPYAVKNDNGIWYIAMEYIDGPTCKTLLETQGKLPADQVLGIAEQIVAALQYAWNECRIIHCDIKPDNIMINSSGQSKLADLGLAHSYSSAEGGSDDLYGTPQYIAPELLCRRPADARSDIYSLGATLYHLLTGQFPYDGASPDEIVLKHLQEPLRPIAEVAPDAPAPLAALIEGMMIKRPDQRYASYDELSADLALVKQGQMPMHPLPSDAQLPIDINAPDPLASSEPLNAAPTATGRVMRLNTAGHTASASQAIGTAAVKSAGNKSPMGLIIAIVAVVLLGGGAAAYFLLGSKQTPDDSAAEAAGSTPAEVVANADGAAAPAADGTAPAADGAAAPAAAGETATPAENAAPAEDPNAPKLADLKQQVAQNSDQTFDILTALAARGATPLAELYAVATPVIEARLRTLRQPVFNAQDERWQEELATARRERLEKERAELARREAEEKERQEAARKAAEEEEREKRKAALAKAKQEKLASLHKSIRENHTISAVMLFQAPFENEDEETKTWRENWLTYVNNADRLHKILAECFINGPTDITVPTYIFYKTRKDAATEDDNYTTVPMTLCAFDGTTATFIVKNNDILVKLPTLQRRKFEKFAVDQDAGTGAETKFIMPYDLLLPEQQVALVHGVAGRNDALDAAEAESLVASSLLVSGNFLHSLFESPAFADYRADQPFLDTVKEEMAYQVHPELAERQAENLNKLLTIAKEHQQDLCGKVYAVTLRRYAATLPQSFPEADGALKDAIAALQDYLKRQ